ncbi:MAG: DUF899 domain-containing protein [Thermomicrobiales bacterium]
MSSTTATAPSSTPTRPMPPIVSRSEWEAARADLVALEDAADKQRKAASAARRRLPMVEITKDYTFTGPDGEVTFLDLFEGRTHLILNYFMFAPTWEAGCPGCSELADSFPHPAHLHARDISLARISRAPYPQLEAYNTRMGWNVPWYSSFDSDFGPDFGLSTDDGEQPDTLVFFRDRNRIFQTYALGGNVHETLMGMLGYLDITPYGRQENNEDSPAGWPQQPEYSWTKRHDEYDSENTNVAS